MRLSYYTFWSLSCIAVQVNGLGGYDQLNSEVDSHDASDLLSFESIPHLRAPRLNVAFHNSSYACISPGSYFTAPYVDLLSRTPTRLYSPFQQGPHIYDSVGELVWSGAHLFPDRTTFDFKVSRLAGESVLSFILGADDHQKNMTGGAGVILDSSYNIIKTVKTTGGRGTANMHEFNLVEDGRAALIITFESTLRERSDGEGSIWLGNNGFQKVDVETGEVLFEWWAADHVDPLDSMVTIPPTMRSSNQPWDFFHMNSVEQDQDGNYVISARFMNSIYKIDGTDGTIMWTLGGKKSSYAVEGFNFSSQHDARLVQDNSTTTVFSFFNNHSNGITATANRSSVSIVALDKQTRTATLVQEYLRPDAGLTHLRGNAQILRDENGDRMFVCWSENSYLSEFTLEGELLMEASFASKRFQSYRAYKYPDFVGTPSQPPALAAQAYGVTPGQSVTVLYVSWNGATEVDAWNFYQQDCSGSTHTQLGSATRTGFETSFTTSGYASRVFAEAIDRDGRVLHTSLVTNTLVPKHWNASSTSCNSSTFNGQESQPDSTREGSQDIKELEMVYSSPNPSKVSHTIAFVAPQQPYHVGGIFFGCFVAFAGFVIVRQRRRKASWSEMKHINIRV